MGCSISIFRGLNIFSLPANGLSVSCSTIDYVTTHWWVTIHSLGASGLYWMEKYTDPIICSKVGERGEQNGKHWFCSPAHFPFFLDRSLAAPVSGLGNAHRDWEMHITVLQRCFFIWDGCKWMAAFLKQEKRHNLSVRVCMCPKVAGRYFYVNS